MLVIVTLNGTVSRFIFIDAVGRYQNRGHHRERTECGRDHIAHDVAVIVLARPDIAAVRTNDARDSIVDQGVEVGDARLFKFCLIFIIKDFLENILEGVIIGFADGILGREP